MRRFIVLLALCACTPPPPDAENAPVPTVGVGLTRVAEYDRSSWGRWKDLDKDCQSTRNEVLIAESTEPVTFDERGCKVVTGRWVCPYTGKIFILPGLLDIDHVVAVAEAHNAGGHAWTKAQKSAYFNDLDNPNHLIAVDRSSNRSKGSRGPDAWLPREEFRCEYLKIRAEVLATYELSYDCGLYLSLMAAHCRSGTIAP